MEVTSDDWGREGSVTGEEDGGMGDSDGDERPMGEEGGQVDDCGGGDDGKEIGGEGGRQAVATVSFSELSVSVSEHGCSTSFVLQNIKQRP